MLDAGLIVSRLAGSELRARPGLGLAFGWFDQLPETNRNEVDLYVEIREVLSYSATAEVGPRSRVVEIERDAAHLSILLWMTRMYSAPPRF